MVKAAIRGGAEAEEREFYEGGRATEEWLKALAPLGTDWRKPFLEIAPWLVVIFKLMRGDDDRLLVVTGPRSPNAGELIDMAFERGVLLLGASSNVVRMSPALVITKDQADFALDVLEESLLDFPGALVLVTHDLDFAGNCDRILRLHDGALAERAPATTHDPAALHH